MGGAQQHRVLPVSNTRDETRATYDRMARFYDLAEGHWERNARLTGIRALALRPGEHVVEIGSGTGEALVELARLVGPRGSVEGVDLSPSMVTRARNRVGAAHLDSEVSLRTGDAVALPYEGGRFDAAFTSFMLELLADDEIPAALAEVLRVLRPGGRLCVVALSRAGEDTLMRRLYERAHVRFPHILDCRPIYVAESLEDAGFEGIRPSRSRLWGLPIETVVGYRPTAHRTPTVAS